MVISGPTQVIMHWKAMLILVMILLVKVLLQYRLKYLVTILFKSRSPYTSAFKTVRSVDLPQSLDSPARPMSLFRMCTLSKYSLDVPMDNWVFGLGPSQEVGDIPSFHELMVAVAQLE